MLVNGGQSANFNYGAYDGVTGLDIGALIYDVTSGSPSFLSGPTPMTDAGAGVYVGSFTPLSGSSYLIIMAAYTDNTFLTVDQSRSPAAINYDAFITDTATLNFNYGAYDQNASLTLVATVFNLTDSSQSSFNMTHVALGVYFGQYTGAITKSYLVVKIPTDPTRPPGVESFQSFAINGGSLVINEYVSPVLIVTGQSLNASLRET